MKSATKLANATSLVSNVLVLLGLALWACRVIPLVGVFNLVAVLVAAAAAEVSLQLNRRARRAGTATSITR